jgi:hypothetical protein
MNSFCSPNKALSFIFSALMLLSSCSAQTAEKDACAIADQSIELSTMFKNNISNVYEKCLSDLRQKVALELE